MPTSGVVDLFNVTLRRSTNANYKLEQKRTDTCHQLRVRLQTRKTWAYRTLNKPWGKLHPLGSQKKR